MTTTSYVETLKFKHRKLDERISKADASYPDAELKRLKVEKLALKDKINHLEAQ